MSIARNITLAAAFLALAACAGSPQPQAPTVVRTVAVAEPGHSPSAVVLHHKPANTRHCWKHKRHWHCRN